MNVTRFTENVVQVVARELWGCGWRLKISEGALETGALWLVPLPSLWLCCSSWLLLLDGESGSDCEPISFMCGWSVCLSLEEWRWRGSRAARGRPTVWMTPMASVAAESARAHSTAKSTKCRLRPEAARTPGKARP